MKRWLIRIAVVLAVIEVSYLAVANVALNLPATQAYLNGLRPDRYAFQWDRAWSWVPFRIQATNLSANGQTWSQQWQVSAPAATASLAVLPLFARTVHVYGLDSADLDVRFRPRVRPDRDDAALRQFYPVIEGRDPNAPIGDPPTQRPGWDVIVDVERIAGANKLWVWGTQLTLSGEGSAIVNRQLHAGPLTISDGQADATVESLTVNGQKISDKGAIKGTFAFAPVILQENRGLKKFAFLTTEADIDLPVERLDFLDFYLRRVTGMTLAGEGEIKGHFAYDKGDLTAGTNLTISANGLTVSEAPYTIDGAGAVDIAVSAADSDTLDATFRFAELSAFHASDNQALFTGKDLQVIVQRTPRILPDDDNKKSPRRVAVTIPSVTVANLTAYQRYLPDKWNVQLLGGSGFLEGQAEMSATDLVVDLTLRSENANLKVKADSFETNLELGLKATGKATAKTAEVDISGSYVDLDDSQVKNRRGDASVPWQARLSVTKGEADVELPEAADAKTGFPGFWSLSRDKDVKGLLETANGAFQAGLTISNLDWVNVFFANPYSLAVYNSTDFEADLTLSSGWLGDGSTLKMDPRAFKLGVLDYIVEGNGGFGVLVEKGGENPDLRLDANLSGASLRLADEKKAVVDQVTLAVTARAKGVSLKDGGKVTALDLSIPSAKITDMTAYNEYLPKGSPLRILAGKGDLAADVKIDGDTPRGSVTMKSSRIDAVIDEKKISGTANLDVKIGGGAAREMAFDIGGSSLRLDGVHVAGGGGRAEIRGWNGRVDLGKGSVVWKKPMKLNMDAAIRMTDTRPLIAIFESHRKTHKWLEKILTLEDVRANASIRVEPGEFLVPYAMAKSDTIDIGVKGLIREGERQGIFYARYGKLAGILEIDNKQRKFGLIGATRKFEEYVPGNPLPGMRDAEASGETSAKKKRNPFSPFHRKK
jgi:hypothetical protein